MSDYVYPVKREHPLTSTPGITRRDWLAGLAMQAIIGNIRDLTIGVDNSTVQEAYIVADAMIAEGNK